MEYGNNLRTVWRGALLGGLLGLMLVLIAVIAITIEGRWSVSRPLVLPLLVLVPVAGISLPVALTACLRVRVRGTTVQHIFLNKVVLRECPISQFVRVDDQGPLRVVFEGGRRMFLLGMRQEEKWRMAHDLERLRNAARSAEQSGHPAPALVACGSPSQAVTVDPAWRAWNDGMIPKLALAIDEERRFADLPILADALEEAGCTDEAILSHCRGPGPHGPGCWVVDLVLAKD
jgi:hypothetical protein